MGVEDKASNPVPQELSQPEVALFELNRKIWEANRYLMSTFFTDETWSVRQGGTYGFPMLEVEGDGENYDWDKQEQVVDKIIADLGTRLSYIEAAYRFPDTLSAFGVGTQQSWVDMMAEREPNKPKSKIAEEILEKMHGKLAEQTRGFEEFLTSDNFRNAFTIHVDKKTGEYQINDLPLDANELRAKWHGWFGNGATSSNS